MIYSKRSYENRPTIETSEICGCYYCRRTYKSQDVKEYVKDRNGETALCPRCGIDSVVPYDSSLDKNEDNFAESLEEWHNLSFRT